MKYSSMFQQVVDVPLDEEVTVYNDDGLEIYLYRPSVLAKRFEGYDPKKNFQIWLKDGERRFRPNHLRVMIDLYLRVRSRPDLKQQLAQAFDGIFYGTDPNDAIASLAGEHFEHFLNSLGITAWLTQLFIVEQQYGYHKPSKYEPPTLFFQGWVRQIIDSNKEIDNLLMSITNGNTPAVKYTYQDDKNHKKHIDNPAKLWWLE